MVHYPHLIQEFGPLKHVSTLRMESKHKFFKSHVKHSENFKNVTKTLSKKHQLMECLHAYDDDVIKILVGEKFSHVKCEEPFLSLISHFLRNNFQTVCYVGRKVSFRGIVYEQNMSVCIRVDEGGNFEICKIKIIIVYENLKKLYFVDETISIVENEEVGVYETVKNNNCSKLSIFSYSTLLSPDPIPSITFNSLTVYVPKYIPFNPKS